METMLRNLATYLVAFMGGTVKTGFLSQYTEWERYPQPTKRWTDEEEITTDIKTWYVTADGKSLVFTHKFKIRTFSIKHNRDVWITRERVVGITKGASGKFKTWTREKGFGRGSVRGYNTPSTSNVLRTFRLKDNELLFEKDGPSVPTPFAHVVDYYVKLHGGTDGVLSLIAPFAMELWGNAAEDHLASGTGWHLNALQVQNVTEFFAYFEKKHKFTKDERKMLLRLCEHGPGALGIARIAGRVEIPNLRTFFQDTGLFTPTVQGKYQEVSNYERMAASALDDMAKGLRIVAPHRRLMFLNCLGNRWGTDGAIDALMMLRQLKTAGEIEGFVNRPSVREYHQYGVYQTRLLRTKLRDIDNKRAQKLDGQIINGDIEVVLPKNTHEVVEWGLEQNHCIGSYANQAADGQVILMGFRRGDEWVGHCSITNGRLDQLLAKHNARLATEDKEPIIKFLEESKIVTEVRKAWI